MDLFFINNSDNNNFNFSQSGTRNDLYALAFEGADFSRFKGVQIGNNNFGIQIISFSDFAKILSIQRGRANGVTTLITGSSDGSIAIAKQLGRLNASGTLIDRNANNRTVICQDKKTKVHWFGFLEPKSNGKFDVVDKSQSTGKTIGKLAENIQLSWCAEVKAAYYPTIYNI